MRGDWIALAAVVALAGAGRRRARGSRTIHHGQDTLYMGTSEENVTSIIEKGIIPGGGWSPHLTKTRTSVFLIDSIEGARMYASHPGKKPAIIEVDARGLDLHPDTDDLAHILTDYKSDIEEVYGEKIPDEDTDMTDEEVERMEEAIESARDGWDGNNYIEIHYEANAPRIRYIPYITIPVDDYGFRVNTDEYEYLESGEEGPSLGVLQYQHHGPVDKSKLKAIYILNEKGDINIKDYGFFNLKEKKFNVQKFSRIKVDEFNSKIKNKKRSKNE